MTDEKKPFRPPLPPGVQPASESPRDVQGDLPHPPPPVKSQQIGLGMVYSQSKLTPSEREALLKMGWKDGDPIPSDMASLLQQSAAVGPSAVELPASSPEAEKTPLSPDQLEVGMDALARASEAFEQTQKMRSMQADDSVRKAMGVAAGTIAPDVEIVDDTKEEQYDGGQPKSETGIDPTLTECPRCQFDLRLRDPVEVTDEDKDRYLQTFLGLKHFQKEMSAYAGMMKAIFRTLTPHELDSCFEQAYLDRRGGMYQSPLAYYEIVNRYRLSLSLVRIEVGDVVRNFPISIPDWEKKLQPEPPTPSVPSSARPTSDLPIKRIYDFMYGDVIRTESMNRTLGGLAGEFNSLVIKLEANSRNAPFWLKHKPST